MTHVTKNEENPFITILPSVSLVTGPIIPSSLVGFYYYRLESNDDDDDEEDDDDNNNNNHYLQYEDNDWNLFLHFFCSGFGRRVVRSDNHETSDSSIIIIIIIIIISSRTLCCCFSP